MRVPSVRRSPTGAIAVSVAGARTLAPIPVSHLVLLLGQLAWITLMLTLGFSAETTIMLLSTATVMCQLSGRSEVDLVDVGIAGGLARRSA